jgi:hypothetical protein
MRRLVTVTDATIVSAFASRLFTAFGTPGVVSSPTIGSWSRDRLQDDTLLLGMRRLSACLCLGNRWRYHRHNVRRMRDAVSIAEVCMMTLDYDYPSHHMCVKCQRITRCIVHRSMDNPKATIQCEVCGTTVPSERASGLRWENS